MRRRIAVTRVATLLVFGCASIERHPVPTEAMDRAIIPGMPEVRDWGDRPSEHFQEDLVQSVRDAWEVSGAAPGTTPADVLVLSGGGSNGAFGAGFLSGWSRNGARPTFKLVTGISTGALIAPYAFLGEDYDDELERAFTTVSTRDVYKIRSPFTIFKKGSLTRTDPLAAKIEEMVTNDILHAIAAEHRRGRRLFVATTHLDAQRLVVWNMGAIAASGRPQALELFRKVLLASASIPVAFPPVYIEVEADGQRYDEMHVDGGVIAELFLWGAMVDIADARRALGVTADASPQVSIYIIRNGQIDAAPEQVEPGLIGIAQRSLTTLLKAVAMGDMLRIWALAERDGIDFNYVGIPPENAESPAGTFSPADMRRLFELGRAIARQPTPWRKVPPAWISEELDKHPGQ
jgi:predicted acylesterase/phospholipase RssA